MKKIIFLSLSALTGLIIPTITAYVLYATPTQKSALPVWLLGILAIVGVVLIALLWSWLVNEASIAFRVFLLLLILEIGLVQLYFVIRNVELGYVILSDNILFIMITTFISGIFALLSTLSSDEPIIKDEV